MHCLSTSVCLAAFSALAIPGASAQPFQDEILRTTLESLRADNGPANFNSFSPRLSGDGRFLAFTSDASSLVPGDGNQLRDIFVRDLELESVERVSISSSGQEADSMSEGASLSGDGRFVAFQSRATNLVTGDTNSLSDVFLHDRQLGTTVRTSIDSQGTEGNGASWAALLSPDGSLVAFGSNASNLVPGDTNDTSDVFVHEFATGTTTRISVTSAGSQSSGFCAPGEFSSDGRWLTFRSSANDLVPGDQNDAGDVFLHDRVHGATTRVSLNHEGLEIDAASGGGQLSGDARWVLFYSEGTNVSPLDLNDGGPEGYDIFLRDLATGRVHLVSLGSTGLQGSLGAAWQDLSSCGRYLSFRSLSDDLVAGDTNGRTDAFVRDFALGRTTRVSVSSAGVQANWDIATVTLAGSGKAVTYASYADTLVPVDLNPFEDVFLTEFAPSAFEFFCAGEGCPCNNDGEPFEGCVNSTQVGARLWAVGSASVAADDLAFQATDLPAFQPALLFVGTRSQDQGFGGGRRCVGGQITRLGVRFANAAGRADFGPGLGASGGGSAGDTRYLQVWYRDPSGTPCGSGFNLTSGVRATFSP